MLDAEHAGPSGLGGYPHRLLPRPFFLLPPRPPALPAASASSSSAPASAPASSSSTSAAFAISRVQGGRGVEGGLWPACFLLRSCVPGGERLVPFHQHEVALHRHAPSVTEDGWTGQARDSIGLRRRLYWVARGARSAGSCVLHFEGGARLLHDTTSPTQTDANAAAATTTTAPTKPHPRSQNIITHQDHTHHYRLAHSRVELPSHPVAGGLVPDQALVALNVKQAHLAGEL